MVTANPHRFVFEIYMIVSFLKLLIAAMGWISKIMFKPSVLLLESMPFPAKLDLRKMEKS